MIVAEIEIYHSRTIAPTRRIALGKVNLPVVANPGVGGVLIAGLIAHSLPLVSQEDKDSLYVLFQKIQSGYEITQPAVRHRYQEDRIGLTLSRQRLINQSGRLIFDFNTDLSSPTQLLLGSLYAIEKVSNTQRKSVLNSAEFAWNWDRELNDVFIERVLNLRGIYGYNQVKSNEDIKWALLTLNLSDGNSILPTRSQIRRIYRKLVREAHPDHGGDSYLAASRIEDLTRARDILVS